MFHDGIPMSLLSSIYEENKIENSSNFNISEDEIGVFTVSSNELSASAKDVNEKQSASMDEQKTGSSRKALDDIETFFGSKISQLSGIWSSLVEKDFNKQASEHGKFLVSFGDIHNYCFCSCSFWQMYKMPCIHMLVIFDDTHEWQYSMLSPLYRSSNIFAIDYSSVNDNKDCEDLNTPTKTEKSLNVTSYASGCDSVLFCSQQFMDKLNQLSSLVADKDGFANIKSEWEHLSKRLETLLHKNSNDNRCVLKTIEKVTSDSLKDLPKASEKTESAKSKK